MDPTTTSRLMLAGLLTGALLWGAPSTSSVQVAATTPQVSALATADDSAAGAGNLAVSVGYVVFGAKLHLRRWPLRAGDRLGVRIDVWIAPNAGDARLTLLEGVDVRLVDCSGTAMRPGRVNRITCMLAVPGSAEPGQGHVRVRISTGHGVYAHSFAVRIAGSAASP